ncbi:MAG TPA: hypothetical protein VGF44_11840 [Terriglobales bacterium]|jgi:hypothetical protein
MKKTGLLVVFLLVGMAFAQTDTATNAAPANTGNPDGTIATNGNFPTIQVTKPTYADLYCSGFISKQLLPNASFVTGGLQTPSTTKYVNGDLLYLAGNGYQVGQQFTVIRELRDPNKFELFHGQHNLLKSAGQPYGELARVRILDTRSKMAVAQVEYSCDPINPGDFVIPFVDKQNISFQAPHTFDRFLPASNRISGRIILAKDFDYEIGTGAKVYLNVGASQGVQVGTYFRAFRRYEEDLQNPVDSLSFKASIAEDTQKRPPSMEQTMFTKTNGPQIHVKDMPRRSVAEIVIIGTTATTATGMITSALEDVHVGDGVELEQ